MNEQYTNSIGMRFVRIEPGTFLMGSPEDEWERGDDEVLHTVTLTKDFLLQTTQVTQYQWEALMGSNPSEFTDNGHDRPVDSVSWKHAQSFIKTLNQAESTQRYRLPTEAEWEFACRAGTKTPFHFGQNLSTDYANFDGNFPYHNASKGEYRSSTLSVASFPANPWGLYDMHGNVWEWCSNRYYPYSEGPDVDPVGPEKGLDIVVRGGSWASFACYCRSAFRFAFYPFYKNCSVGFRLARDI